jgi:hypothetical protein
LEKGMRKKCSRRKEWKRKKAKERKKPNHENIKRRKR